MADWQRQDIRDTLYAGFFKCAQSRPVFKGKVKTGYKRVALRVDGVLQLQREGRAKTTLEKDHSAAHVMAALEREFDRQPTLAAVVVALRIAGVKRLNAKGHGVWDGFWEGRDLKAILRDPIYTGEWRLLNRDPVSDVWALLRHDGFDPVDIRHPVPHLAWFTRSQVARWVQKFSAAPPGKSRRPHHPHLLIGVLACPECGTMFHRGAANDSAGIMYRCRGVRRPHASGRETSVSERTALRALREYPPSGLLDLRRLLGS